MSTVTLAVAGLTCQHCAMAVSQEVSAIPGVSEVEVELVAGGLSRVSVTSSRPLDHADLDAAIEEAGYGLVDASA